MKRLFQPHVLLEGQKAAMVLPWVGLAWEDIQPLQALPGRVALPSPS